MWAAINVCPAGAGEGQPLGCEGTLGASPPSRMDLAGAWGTTETFLLPAGSAQPTGVQSNLTGASAQNLSNKQVLGEEEQ